MESGHLPPFERAILAEKRGEQAPHALAYRRIKVVQNHLGLMVRGSRMPLSWPHDNHQSASAGWPPGIRTATALHARQGRIQRLCQDSTRSVEQHTFIFLDSFRLESLKCAVGPCGKCTSKSPFTSFLFSFNTMRLVKPRLLAYSATFFTE